ncbi:BTAD domain-containing putative transcriptional regulator [Streptacidiphilus sp. P02-A3a]|uniref:AfsR/SARP family transcriptional regulator n=1 Tax=Streptacidiphilus sp. P02-A3a TaxID=2704468 RepID=UPI0015FC54FD|nr:BTAD domain-containing putative transcriptional regulator [Streptacidiphilus sp. P02-A3a]QMU70579.1 tetratricopeptide repeat protein [Streptacidiphilus sp. P02-A3a]
MRFNLLGPLSVDDGRGEPVALPAGIPRTVLAVLLLNANQAVSGEKLAQAVWGEERPAATTAGLRNHVSRLRRQLGPAAGRVLTVPDLGYLAQVGDGELDTRVFTDTCAEGRRALHAGDNAAARDTLATALALWRGEPLSDLPTSADAAAEIQRLEETRLLALEGRIEADLRLGRHSELVAETQSLVRAHPLREELHRQLMLALYRAGRQAESLEAFQGLRRTLVEQLGVEPSAPLRELHGRILRADPDLAAPAPTPGTGGAATPGPGAAAAAAPAAVRGPRFQLPVEPRTFTGRTRELDRLLALAREAPTGSAAGMVVVSAIDGMAGIGKTALAIRAAHRVREQFPDGQLFIDLHGHTPGMAPLDAGTALDWFLRSLGVPPQLIPVGLGERAAFYRDRLAGTRTLIFLDNAAGAAQVRPLLPATPGCLVMVTSRRRLTGLEDAQSLALDVLPEADAVALLHTVAGPGRIPQDHPAVAELAALCGRMPLAIRITAARLRHRRALRIEDVVEQLHDEHRRLDYLQDADRDLAAVFESSYTALTGAEQRLFRLLAVVPGADFDVYAAANLAGVDERAAERLLESLLDHNLLTQHTPGRYQFHDLLRLYARTLGGQDPGAAGERDTALRELLDYYQQTADLADGHLARYTRPGPPRAAAARAVAPGITDRATALAWMRAEHDNLLAGVGRVADQPRRLIALTGALTSYLQQDGPWPQAVALHRAAATAARESDDRLGEANALWDLGRIHYQLGDLAAATGAQEQALAIYQDLGSVHGEARGLYQLGRLRLATGDFPGSAELQERSIAAYRSLPRRLSEEADALQDLGRVRYAEMDLPAAVELFQRALAIFQEFGDGLGEANAHWDLGRMRFAAGDLPEATALFQRSLTIYQDIGSRQGEANALGDLGRVRQAAGDFPVATALQEQALAIFQDIGHRPNEAFARCDLGRVRFAAGDVPAAAEQFERALTIFQDIGSRQGEANARRELGRVRQATGDLTAAAELLERALSLFQDLGEPQGVVEVLVSTGALVAETTGPAEARAVYRRAVDLAREIGSVIEEAMALEGGARCAARAGDRAAALLELRQAVGMYRRIGAAEADRASAFLAALEAEDRTGQPHG